MADPEKCSRCKGAKRVNIPFMGIGRCPDCNGTGVGTRAKVTCPSCHGRRDNLFGQPCAACGGEGEVPA